MEPGNKLTFNSEDGMDNSRIFWFRLVHAIPMPGLPDFQIYVDSWCRVGCHDPAEWRNCPCRANSTDIYAFLFPSTALPQYHKAEVHCEERSFQWAPVTQSPLHELSETGVNVQSEFTFGTSRFWCSCCWSMGEADLQRLASCVCCAWKKPKVSG